MRPAIARSLKILEGPCLWKALALVLALGHALFLFYYAVDLPFWDEWEFFHPSQAGKTFSWEWLLAFHNEHRIFWTRLVFLIQQKLNFLDFRLATQINFALYLLTVGVVFKFAKRVFERSTRPLPGMWPFAIFFFSTASLSNFYNSFQSQVHFSFLFFVLALIFFQDARTWVQGAGILASVASLYAMSLGLVLGTVALMSFILFRGAGRFIRGLAFVALVLSVFFWSRGYPSMDGGGHPAWVWPIHYRFWLHYVATFTWVFGLEGMNDLGNIVGFILLGSFFWGLSKILRSCWTRRTLSTPDWAMLTWTLGILAGMAAISMARSGFGSDQGKSSRYAEIPMMLIPSLVYVIHFGDAGAAKARKLYWALFLLCLIGFSNDFAYWSAYKKQFELRSEAVACLKRSVNHDCTENVYPFSVSDRIPIARALGATFVRSIEE